MPFRNKVVKERDKDGKMHTVMIEDPETGEMVPKTEPEEFLDAFLAKDKTTAEKLYSAYKPTLDLLANKYAYYTGADKDDLVEEGLIGLARAARDFEEDRSNDFQTFAIYKITDAMKEFSTTQATNINVPRYILEAKRLVNKLHKMMASSGLIPHETHNSLKLWEESGLCDKDKAVIEDITNIRRSIRNLAERSGTSVEALIERSDLYAADALDVQLNDNLDQMTFGAEEDEIIRAIMIPKAIQAIQDILSEDEYNLIYEHFVNGKTVRDLSDELGTITAAGVTIKIGSIIQKLQKNRRKIPI